MRIHAFSEKSTGDLSPLAVSSFATIPRPVSIALHPSKNFLYVPNQTSNTVSGFTIDHTAGVLTPIGTALPPTPVCNPGVCSNPIGVAVNSGGQFLFVLNQGSASPAVPASISVFNIDQTRGLLSPVRISIYICLARGPEPAISGNLSDAGLFVRIERNSGQYFSFCDWNQRRFD